MITTWIEEELKTSKINEDTYKEMNNKLWVNNVNVNNKPKLIISTWCNSHIRALHIHSPSEERMAICKVEPLWNGIFKVVDMIHPEQKTQGAEVSATDNGMDWCVDELISRKEDLSKWNMVLHSHHHMGCFWSSTDDNSRLDLNDGRFMSWAVVTAYSGTPKDWQINYKGCVNFYKPYNIEIDAEVEAEWEDYNVIMDKYYEYYNTRDDKVKALAQEIYNRKVEENITEVERLLLPPSYNNIIEYLWINIEEELKENYKQVMVKLPPQGILDLKDKLNKEAIEEAENQIPINIEIPNADVLNWADRSNELIEQLDEHKVKQVVGYKHIDYSKNNNTVSSFPTAYNYDYNYDYENYYDDYDYGNWEVWYTTSRYKKASDLKKDLGLWDRVQLRQWKGWVWEAFNPLVEDWQLLDNCISDLWNSNLY